MLYYFKIKKNMFKSKDRKKIEWLYKIVAILIAISMIIFLLIPLFNYNKISLKQRDFIFS